MHYTCNACQGGFNFGHGVRMGEEHFCYPCFDQNSHYEYYANAGATVKNIIDLTNKIVDL